MCMQVVYKKMALSLVLNSDYTTIIYVESKRINLNLFRYFYIN